MEDKFLKIKVFLGKDFSQKLDDEISDEIIETMKKYKVENLSENQVLEILDHTIAQLEEVVSRTFATQWNSDDESVSCLIPYRRNLDFTEGDSELESSQIRLKRVRGKISVVVEDEDLPSSFPLSQFPDFARELILKWAKSGVYYGVASYA